MQTERYPLDYEALAKGDYIPPERIERISGCKRSDRNFAFACMRLKEEIQKNCDGFCVKQEGFGLRIQIDSEASGYLAALNNSRYRGIIRSNRLLMKVDQEKLTPAQQREHERRMFVQSRMLQAALAERRAIERADTTNTKVIDLQQEIKAAVS
jgi:hypothetical protein